MTTDITQNEDGSVSIRLNEDKISICEKFADTRQVLRETANDCICGVLYGDVGSLHATYVERREETGVSALEIDMFWHKFRRRFPGTYWGYTNYGTEEEPCTGRAVFVVLGLEDKSLASSINKFGWFVNDGYDAVLDAFIKTQDSFSGEPHPEDEIEKSMPFDFRGVRL
jgi:hypothetical protein